MSLYSNENVSMKDVISLVVKTGAQIMRLIDEGLDVDYKLNDRGQSRPFTNADVHADKMLHEGLAKITPNIPVVSEEAPDSWKDVSSKAYWACDSIDGTTLLMRYNDGDKESDGFAILLGLIEDGQPTRGVVYYPVTQELYFTGDNGLAYYAAPGVKMQQIELAQKQPADRLTELRMGEGPPDPKRQIAGIKVEQTAFTKSGLYAAMGRSDHDLACFNNNPWYWDIAGPHAVLKAMGGDIVSKHTGAPISYGAKDILRLDPNIGGEKSLLDKLGLARQHTDKPAISRPKHHKIGIVR